VHLRVTLLTLMTFVFFSAFVMAGETRFPQPYAVSAQEFDVLIDGGKDFAGLLASGKVWLYKSRD